MKEDKISKEGTDDKVLSELRKTQSRFKELSNNFSGLFLENVRIASFLAQQALETVWCAFGFGTSAIFAALVFGTNNTEIEILFSLFGASLALILHRAPREYRKNRGERLRKHRESLERKIEELRSSRNEDNKNRATLLSEQLRDTDKAISEMELDKRY